MKPLTLRTPLFPYQEECVNEIEDFNLRCLLALDPGLGKSIISLAAMQRHPEIECAVVICPAVAKWHWEREARTHLGIRAEVLTSHKVTYNGWRPASRLWIINYTILYSWMEFLFRLKPQLIICDECQDIRGLTTQRAMATRVLCEKVKHLIFLSGTPLVNRPSELWPTLNILRPKRWPDFNSFGHRHCGPRLTHRGWTFRGATHLKELHHDLQRHVMVRRRKEDVLRELPPKSKHIVPLDITNRREYNTAVKDFIGWLHNISPGKAARAARSEEVTKIGYLLRLAGELKIENVCKWVDGFLESGSKLLLFAIHKKVTAALEERYKRICIRVDGSVTGDKRQKAFDQFNKVERTRLLIGNVDAAGVAWSCSAASDVAFCELPWAPGALNQAIDRCHGLNRGVEGKTTRAWLLVAHGTIEEKLCEVLQRKQHDVAATLDGGAGESDLDIHDELLRTLKGGQLNGR